MKLDRIVKLVVMLIGIIRAVYVSYIFGFIIGRSFDINDWSENVQIVSLLIFLYLLIKTEETVDN